jgi:hypothetical protein
MVCHADDDERLLQANAHGRVALRHGCIFWAMIKIDDVDVRGEWRAYRAG